MWDPFLIGFFLTRPPFMLSHPTIKLNMTAWLIRNTLRPQTLTWAGVDPLIADINLPRLIVSIGAPRVIIKIKFFLNFFCRVYLVILCSVLPTFLTSRCFVWINHCNSTSAYLSACLFNEMQASLLGVYHSNVRLAFALYRPVEEKILDNLSIKISCEWRE
jgi:hypothetical protein